MNARLLLACLLITASVQIARADGPSDNLPDKVRRVPPPGVVISEADRGELSEGTAALAKDIAALRNDLKGKPALLDLLPDVLIYHKAVQWALDYNEFFKSNEVQVARNLLKQGGERAQALREGRAPWISATGLVVRGYLSRVDGSVQPYGLVVPASFQPGGAHRHRLDFWFHGRGETLSELDFINGRQRSIGEFAPSDTIVLHPYGRYCNGNRFAGETDAFEALDHARKFYPIDEERVLVRGFSLGGAACWDMAVHHAWRWAAAAPGAGFSETADFLKVFQSETLQPAWYEQKLWHLYDAIDWAVNLAQCPTVAYSGEIDRQKQAADMMVKALAAEGIELTHIIGPKTAHSYEADAKREVSRRIDSIASAPRVSVPRQVRFTTWTLKYNRMNWVIIDALQQHWERAGVEASFDDHTGAFEVTTRNVTAFTLSFDPGRYPLDLARPPAVSIDGKKVEASRPQSDRSWTLHLRKNNGAWERSSLPDSDASLRKRHDLQGPIDDAFMESFLMVRPTGQALNGKVGAWAAAEFAHATNHWRQQFRGDARIKDDTAITTNDIAAHHLVLWGDPSSNELLKKIAGQLPLQWSVSQIALGQKMFDASHHVPVLIYPNPLNPKKYIVLNSGFTFREYDYLNNARQTPKLPDYAIVDVDVPVTSRAPGGIVHAGFFGEKWEVTAAAK